MQETIRQNRSLPRTVIALIWVTIFLCLGGITLGVASEWYYPLDAYLHQIPFDSPVWKSKSKDFGRWQTRQRMVDDLLAKNVLQNKTRSEVESLLGKPDLSGGLTDAVYFMGLERGPMKIDGESLRIRYDFRGRFVRATSETG